MFQKLINYSSIQYGVPVNIVNGVSDHGFVGTASHNNVTNNIIITLFDEGNRGKMSPLSMILTLAHEIGHVKDFTVRGIAPEYSEALRQWHYGHINENQRNIILLAESLAWVYGIELLIHLNCTFDMLNHANMQKDYDLGTYKKQLVVGQTRTYNGKTRVFDGNW
jgi:hypothetical protein